MGLPDLQKYFYAAQLAQLSRFHSKRSQAIWMIMESYACRPSPTSHILWLPPKDRPTILCPSLSFSLDIWDRVSRTQAFKSPHSPLAPLLRNRAFTPGLDPVAFQWWTNKGLLRIADLCDRGKVLSEQVLREKYQMPLIECYRYVQICHFIQMLARQGDLEVHTPMEYLCVRYDSLRGHISELYAMLMSSSTKLNYMLRWEEDLQETFDLNKWCELAETASKSLINTSIIEANYKVLLRWYMVPARLATFVHGATPNCFRGCGQVGTAYHIWWSCPKVRRFWIRVYNFIYSLTQLNMTKSAKQALLGDRVVEASKAQRRLLMFIFISAKITIARNWRAASLPLEQLKRKLSWLMLNERLTALIQDKLEIFHKVWDPWLAYLASDLRSLEM